MYDDIDNPARFPSGDVEEDFRVNNEGQISLFDDNDLAQPVTYDNETSLLALSALPGVGFLTLRSLFEAYNGDLTQVWTSERSKLTDFLKKARVGHPDQIVDQIKSQQKQLLGEAEEKFQRLRTQRRVSILFRYTPQYPALLNQLPSPPSWLFIEGDANVLHDPTIVGVVGTRKPTVTGIQAAKRLSSLLVRAGCVIVSGLAEGIDAAAQQVAVDNGTPTVAVLGHGIDVVYPQSTSGLRREIVERGGAVVSEYLPSDTVTKERFVQRNRIQAGLSHAVAVVEGESKSGTAHTVRFTVELSRPLFGVRLGDAISIPQQELLQDIQEKHNAPIFDIDGPEGRSSLGDYLKVNLTLKAPKDRPRVGRLFHPVFEEIRHVASSRHATDRDFDWLVNSIERLRWNLLHENKDAGTDHAGPNDSSSRPPSMETTQTPTLQETSNDAN